MGTRGGLGYILDGKTVMMYNHFDSYPSGLGADFLEDVKKIRANIDFYKKAARNVKFIGEEKPTVKDIKKLGPYTNLNVSEQSTDDWYCLTRGLQGHLAKSIEVGYIDNFAEKTDWMEYIYLYNFDNDTVIFDWRDGKKVFSKKRLSIKDFEKCEQD